MLTGLGSMPLVLVTFAREKLEDLVYLNKTRDTMQRMCPFEKSHSHWISC